VTPVEEATSVGGRSDGAFGADDGNRTRIISLEG
jgi:hypothetical protein